MGVSTPFFATQAELDEIDRLFIELTRVEAYQESSQCTAEEYKDCEVERISLSDRLEVLIDKLP